MTKGMGNSLGEDDSTSSSFSWTVRL